MLRPESKVVDSSMAMGLVDRDKRFADLRRRRYLHAVERYSDDQLVAELVRYDAWAAAEQERRSECPDGTAWTSVPDLQRGFLHRMVRERCQAGWIQVIRPPATALTLRRMRLNKAAGSCVVEPDIFRMALQQVVHAGIMPEVLIRIAREPASVVVMLPLRTAVFGGEVYRSRGVKYFWPVDVQRDRAARPVCGTEFPPPTNIPGGWVIVHDPLLATAGSALACIDRAIAEGAHVTRMILHVVVAAPEGIRAIQQRYPELRIVANAIDNGLDQHAYVEGPGIGDCGYHACHDLRGDVGQMYAQQHWRGWLPERAIELVLARTEAEIQTKGDCQSCALRAIREETRLCAATGN